MDRNNSSDSFTEPEDFDYVEVDDESRDTPGGTLSSGELKRTKPRHRMRRFLIWTVLIVLAVLVTAFWLRYINPYVVGSHERGYVVSLEYRGMIFKTWEGEMIAQKALTDTVKVYSHSFLFSVDNAEVANKLEEYCGTGKPVSVTYNRFMGALPWRGSQTCVVTGVEAID